MTKKISRSKLIALYTKVPRIPVIDIASMLGVKVSTVNSELTKLARQNLIVRRQYNGEPMIPTTAQFERMKQIIQLRRRGLTLQEIGDHFNLTRQAVQQFIKYYMPEFDEQYKADIAAQNEITKQQLISLYKQIPVLTQKQIAKALKVDPSYVSRTIALLIQEKVLISRFNDNVSEK